MIELPKAITIGRQVEQILAGRKVTNVYGATYLHKFTFFNGTPDEYASRTACISFSVSVINFSSMTASLP